MFSLAAGRLRKKAVLLRSMSCVGVMFATVLLVPTAAVSNPAPPPHPGGQQAGDGTVSLTMSDPNSLAAGSLVCDVTVDSPHYSTGAAGVIAKLRYSCVGNLQGELKMDLNLYRYSPGAAGPYAPRANNYENRVVTGGSTGTMYVPAQTQGGIYCNTSHWYFAYADLVLVAGLSRDYGSANSNTVHPSRCS